MTDARETALTEFTRDSMSIRYPTFISRDDAQTLFDKAVAALASAGFRILGPDEIDGPTVEKCAEEKQAVITLLYTDEVFVGSHWEDYPNAGAGVWPTLCAHVSSYGSDAEEIPESEIVPLARLVDEYGRDAVQAWVCHRRGNERPSKGQLTDAGKAALRALKEKGK